MLRTVGMYKTIIYLFLPISVLFAFDGNAILRELGEKQYQMIKAKSSLSHHGTCWHNAIQAMKSSCSNLNDQEHSLMALKLTNCFLEDSGHETYNCHHIESENQQIALVTCQTGHLMYIMNIIYMLHTCAFI